MFLHSYDFNIIHRPGRDNVVADTLSKIYEEREVRPRANMILVDPVKKKAIKRLYSATTRNSKHNLHLTYTQDPVRKPSFFSTTSLNSFSIL